MATDMQRLVVALEARTAAFEKAMLSANGVANTRAKAIESRFAKMNTAVGASFARLGGIVLSTAALRGAQQLIDSATRIENALKVAGLSGDELAKVYDRLFTSAQKNAAPIESLVELYSRASLVQKELGVSTDDLLKFTDKVAVALRVSGRSAQESSGALLQLSQALGSGIVRAEEFNSVLEGALPIAQAAAAGLKEAGGSVAKLRQLVVDGKVSSEAFFRAFEAGSVILDDKVAGAQLTVAQGWQQVENALVKAAGKFDDATGASQSTAGALEQLATAIQAIGDFFTTAGNAVGYFSDKIDQLAAALANIGSSEIFGLLGKLWGVDQKEVDRINGLLGGGSASTSGPTDIGTITQGAPTAVKPVSLGDFKAPSGSGSGKKAKQNDYQREIAQIKERTAALVAETAAQAGLNPLIDDYGYAVTKAKSVQELLNAAQKAGIAITPELEASIDALAESYAQATVASAQLAEEQDKIRQAAEDMRSLGKDVLGGFISDLRSGTSASEALRNALNKVLDKLIEISLNSIFDGKSGGIGGIFGAIGSLFGFADGGIASRGRPMPIKAYARGGVAKSASVFGEAGPEAAVPLPDGRRIPVDLRVPQGGKGGQGAIAIQLSPDLEARILKQAEGQSIKVVSGATPGIVKSAKNETIRSFTNGGDGEKMMRGNYQVSTRSRRAV